MKDNLRMAKAKKLLIILVVLLTSANYSLIKAKEPHRFHFLWEETIRPEARIIRGPGIELKENYVGISIEYDNYTSPLYRFFLYDDAGLIWKKKIVGKVYGHEIARDGRHVLVFLSKKGSSVAHLYSNKGELIWQSKDHDFYRFSEDGKQIITNVASELEYFKTFSVFDLNGRVLWRREFNEDLLDGISFNNGIYVLVKEVGPGKTYFIDTRGGLLWEKEWDFDIAHKVSDDGQLILSYPGAGSLTNILFSLIDLKGNILFEGKESMKLSEKDTITLPGFWFNGSFYPGFFYKDKVFIEGTENDYLIDIKGNVEAITIRSDFIRQFGLDQKEREQMMLSPNLKYLLYQPNGGMVIRYYKID